MINRMRTICLLLCIILFSSACGRHRKESIIDNQKLYEEEVSSITIIGTPDTNTEIFPKVFCDSLLTPHILYKVANQLLIRSSYVVSYNQITKCPNWVAWHLTSEHVDGTVKRMNGYWEDKEVPRPRATIDDYRGTKWSHGHMCPAGDNKWDEQAMHESNLLTNICPQDRGLNSGVWNKIEQDCRRWAKKFGDVYIVCGPVLLNKEHETIGKNKVVVPEAFFKVILCLQGKPKAIGFVVRNNEGKKKRDQFINTIDEVERITGIDFFPALPDSIENDVEAYSNIEDWR